MWILFASLSAITAALVAVFGKLGMKGIDPTLTTTIRAFIMASMLGLTALFAGKFRGFNAEEIATKDWLFILLAALAGAASWLFYFLALKYGDASRVSAIDRMSIVLVVLFASIFLGEHLGWKGAIGAIMVFSGALMIAWK